MQTPGMTGQDPQQQPYITLQPVNVDGSELSNNTLVQDGVNLQQAVMGSTEINSDGKQISTESGQQVRTVVDRVCNISYFAQHFLTIFFLRMF